MRISPPTPELAVHDVLEAQTYFRDRLGFTVGWVHDQRRMGAVSHGDCVLFMRETDREIHPNTFWIFTDNVDDTFDELSKRGADVVAPPENKSWGLRQFTIKDLHGNLFHFHHDL